MQLPKPMNWQRAFLNEQYRFKVIRGGRRVGKTTLIIIDALSLGSIYPNLSLAYVGPSYTSAKDILWADLIKISKDLIEYKNEQELYVRLKNGSRIRLYSWESIDNMLGKKYHKVYLDEVAVARKFWVAWRDVVEPTLLDYKGEAWFTSMPRGKGHFKELCDYASITDGWKQFHITSYENTSIPGIKAELDSLKNRVPPSVFAQQYLAEFTDLEGRVYTEFTRDDLLDECPFEPERYGFSVDFGYNHPLAAYVYAISSDDHIHVINELYENKLDDEMRLKRIKELVDGYDVSIAVADSEDPIAIQQLNRELPFNIKPAAKPKGSVSNGINSVKTKLHTKELTISSKCINLADELETYSWKINKNGKETDEPIKENDDGCDSLRYFVTYMENKPESYTISDFSF